MPDGREHRPPPDVVGHELAQWLVEEVAQIGEDVATEHKHGLEMRRAVIQFGRSYRIVVWSLVVAGIAAVLFGAYFISRNREAIRVSCTLLGNAVIQSGAGGQANQPQTPVAKAVAERQRILIVAIQDKLLTSAQMKRLRELDQIIAKAGGVVAVPQCDEIVADPGSVRSLLKPVEK